MSENGLRPSDRVKLRITSQLEASKQFLVILIGLAVANAVAEKLKYSLDGSVLELRDEPGHRVGSGPDKSAVCRK